MKLFYLLALLTGIRSFAGDSLPRGKTIEAVICKADPSQSYAVYIPIKDSGKALPVIYFFDPHGSGILPVNKYKTLADTYGFILVGSNNSKNGNDWSTTEKIWQRLYIDSKGRLPIDGSRIYTGGFSGGAKAASFVGIQHPEIKGVIAGGAGLPDGIQAENFGFSFTAIAGEGDMNMTDLVAMTAEMDKTHTRHRLLFFDGKHEWAPPATMGNALAGLELDAMATHLIPKDDGFIRRYVTRSKSKITAAGQAGQWISVQRECSAAISYLDGLTPEADWFKAKVTSLKSNAQYQKQRQQQQNILTKEQNIKLGYMQHFQQLDPVYWTTVINDLQVKSKGATPEKGMYQRLLAYLSLAFYSFSNRLIHSTAAKETEGFVALYKLADPTNSEAWYFSAILSARNGQAQAVENDLQKAVEYGFSDKERLQQQPEFKKIDLSRILRSMTP